MLSFASFVMSFRTHDPTNETTLENHEPDNIGNGADMVSVFGMISCRSVYFDAPELIIKASDSLLLPCYELRPRPMKRVPSGMMLSSS